MPWRLLVPVLLSLGACSRGGGPVEELRSLFEVLGNPNVSASRLGSQLYEVLDDASRAAVDARAKALGEKLGTRVDADEILQVRGLVAVGGSQAPETVGARVAKVELITRDEDRATIEVQFAPILFDPRPGETASGPPVRQPTRLDLVKQSGKWRIAFVDLAKLVQTMPMIAGGE